MTRAQTVLQARRRIVGAAPDWALSPAGLESLRGDGDGGTAEANRAGKGDRADDAPEPLAGDPLAGELAALDPALESSASLLARDGARAARRDPLIYDPDWAERERLKAWRRAAAASQSEPPLLAAAVLWDAWESDPPLERQAGLGGLLLIASLRRVPNNHQRIPHRVGSHTLCRNPLGHRNRPPSLYWRPRTNPSHPRWNASRV